MFPRVKTFCKRKSSVLFNPSRLERPIFTVEYFLYLSMTKRERTLLNAEGDFYVEKDTCLACMAPEYSAPDLMGYDSETGCCFKKQPVTSEELERAIEAVEVSCIAALRYCGNNPEIIQKLRRAKEIDGEERCDVLD